MDDFDTQIHSDEFDGEEPWTEGEVQELDVNGEYDGFLQAASESDSLCVQCRTHEAVEDGFCSPQCEQMWSLVPVGSTDEGYSADCDGWRYEDILSQYDDDPDVYSGTYSEE